MKSYKTILLIFNSKDLKTSFLPLQWRRKRLRPGGANQEVVRGRGHAPLEHLDIMLKCIQTGFIFGVFILLVYEQIFFNRYPFHNKVIIPCLPFCFVLKSGANSARKMGK